MKISKELKVGIVTTLAIACFIYGFNFLKGRDIFSSQRKFYAVYSNIDGLVEANPLLINGFKVGIVGKIKLSDDNAGRLIVTLLVDNDVKIPKNTVAKVFSSDLLGSKAVQLKLGTSTVYASNGDTLIAEQEDDLKTSVNKAIAPLQEKAVGLIASIDSVMYVVQTIFNENARQNLAHSFESIKSAIASLERSSYRLDTMIKEEKSTISSILNKVNILSTTLANNSDKLGDIINNFSNISDSLARANITSTINNADAALGQANEIFTKINSGTGTMGMLINNDSLYRKLDKSAEDLDKLLIDLRERPNRYVHVSVFGKKDKSK